MLTHPPSYHDGFYQCNVKTLANVSNFISKMVTIARYKNHKGVTIRELSVVNKATA